MVKKLFRDAIDVSPVLRGILLLELLYLVQAWIWGPLQVPAWVHPEGWALAQHWLGMFSVAYRIRDSAIAILLPFCAALLRAKAWHLLARGLDGALPFGQVLRVWFAAQTAGFLVPAGLDADAYRVAAAQRGARAAVLATVLADRMVGFLAFAVSAIPLVIVLYMGMHENPVKLSSGVPLAAILAVAGSVVVVLYRPQVLRSVLGVLPMPDRARQWLGIVAQALTLLVRDPLRLVQAVLLAIASNMLIITALASMLDPWHTDFSQGVSLALAFPALAHPWIFDLTAVKGVLSGNVLESMTTVIPGKEVAFAVCTLLLWRFTQCLPAYVGVLVFCIRGIPRLPLNVRAIEPSPH